MELQDLQPCKLLLVITNYGIFAYLVVLIYRHISSHHDLKSFSFIFHVLCTVWLFFRGIFWISTLTSALDFSPGGYYLLYWMPVPVEFVSFLLFPLYFIQIIYPIEWREYEHMLIPMYVLVIVLLLSFQAIFIIVDLMSKNEENRECGARECFHMDIKNVLFRAVTAVCFLLLATIQAVYALKLHTVERIRYERYLSCSREMMFYVNCVMVASFASRSLYQILGAFDIYILPDVPLSEDGDAPVIVFLFFELWDYIPTILLITTITSRSMGDDAAAHRNLNINIISRHWLLGDKHTLYGTVDSLEAGDHDHHDHSHNRSQDPLDNESQPLYLHFAPSRDVELPHIPTRERDRDRSLTNKRDNSNERESQSMKELAAQNIVERFMAPSLIPTDSSMMVREAARSWHTATPSGSQPSSYNNNYPANTADRGIHAYATSHGQRPGAGAGIPLSIPPLNLQGRGMHAGSCTSSYGSGSIGATPPGGPLISAYNPHTASVSSSIPSTAGSVSNCSDIIKYHAKQLQAAHLENITTAVGSEHGDQPSPRGRQHAHNPHFPLGPQHPRSYSISSTDSNRPLKPGYSPKTVGKSLPRPLQIDTDTAVQSHNQSVNNAYQEITSPLQVTLETGLWSPVPTVETPRSLSPGPPAPPLQPTEAYECQVEPGTSHHSNAAASLDHYIQSQPLYLQEDYQQFIHQQYLNNEQQRQATMQNNRSRPPPQVNQAPEPGTSPSYLRLYIPSPDPQHQHQRSNAPPTTLPPGAYLVPMQMSLAAPSPFSGTDRSLGSLEFSNDTSPSLQALSSSAGAGGNSSRVLYQYGEHSAHSGIGMDDLSQMRLPSGESSMPTSPQLPTMQPHPRRPNLSGRNLGFDTPSPRRQLDSRSNSFVGDRTLFDRDGTNSFSPAFLSGSDFDSEGYLQRAQEQHREDVHRMNQEHWREHHAPYGTATNRSTSNHQQVTAAERQEVARANALLRQDHKEFGSSV